MLFPPTGLPAVITSLRAGRLAKQGKVEEARLKGERAREWAWYSVGIGLMVYVVAFLIYLLLVKDGAVRKVNFNWEYLGSGEVWRGHGPGLQPQPAGLGLSALVRFVVGLPLAGGG